MIDEIPSARIDVDRYTELRDTITQGGVDAVILPGGGADALERYLTCAYGKGWTCGDFVCYRHNPDLIPADGEPTIKIPSTKGNFWSREIPRRIVKQFEDQLEVTIG